jgi:hypothetical protein
VLSNIGLKLAGTSFVEEFPFLPGLSGELEYGKEIKELKYSNGTHDLGTQS